MNFHSTPHTPHFLHNLFFVISSSEPLISTNKEATHYTIPPAYSKTAAITPVNQCLDGGMNTFVLLVEEGGKS
jgi:hypothetical protein